MGTRKRPEAVLAAIEEREQIHGLVEPRVPKPAKYKRDSADDHLKLPDRPVLKVGQKIVFTIKVSRDDKKSYGRTSIAGYGIGVVLDWESSSSDLWRSGTNAIVQVTKVSNPEFAEMVGRLKSIELFNRYWDSGEVTKFTPQECRQEDYRL